MLLTKKMKRAIFIKAVRNNIAQIILCTFLAVSGITLCIVPEDGTGGIMILMMNLAVLSDTADKMRNEIRVLTKRKLRILEGARRKRKQALVRQLETFGQEYQEYNI